MDRELARKRSAQIITRPDALPRRETLRAPLHSRVALLKDVHRLVRTGQIGHTYKMRQTLHGWEVVVIRIKERPRFPHWTWKVALAAGFVLGFLVALVWVVKLLVVALLALLPVAIGGAVILAVIALLSGGGVITVTQIVKIKK